MLYNLFNKSRCFFMMTVAILLTACGGANNLQNLQTNVDQLSEKLDSVAQKSPKAIAGFDMDLNKDEKCVTADIKFAPGLFNLSLLQPALAEYAIAAYLHDLNADNNRDAEVADMINNMAKTDYTLNLMLASDSGNFDIVLASSRLKTLFKEQLQNLNRTSAAANAAELTGSWAEKVFRTPGASDFECVYRTNEIVITVTFPSVKESPLNDVSNPTPALKGMLGEAARAHYALYGDLQPAITRLMLDLGVKDLRLTYKYSDGRQAPSVRLEWGQDI